MTPVSKIVDMKGLRAKLEAKMAEISACKTVLEEAEKAEDAEAIQAAAEQLDQFGKDFDEIATQLDTAKADVNRKNVLARVRELSQPAPAQPNIADQTVPAKPKNHDEETQTKRDLFFKFMGAKGSAAGLSGQELELLTPKSEKLREHGKADAPCVVIPRSMTAKFLGRNYARAFGIESKDILSVNDADTNPSRANFLFAAEFMASMQDLPGPAPVMLNRVNIVPSATGTITWPSLTQTDTATGAGEFGGVSMTWITEGAKKQETEPEFEQITIQTYEVAGYTEVSERALSRSQIQLEAYLNKLFSDAMKYELDRVILRGTGVAQPAGIIGGAGVRTVPRATAGAVGYADFVALKHEVRSYHRSGAIFVLHDDVEEANEQATDTLGRPLFTAAVSGGAYDRITGVPYEVSYNCPALGVSGDVVYGNPRNYTLAMEEEIVLARSDHYRFQSDLVAFRIYAVAGGRPMQPRAFAYLDDVES